MRRRARVSQALRSRLGVRTRCRCPASASARAAGWTRVARSAAARGRDRDGGDQCDRADRRRHDLLRDGLAGDRVAEPGAAETEDQQHRQRGPGAREHERLHRRSDVIVAPKAPRGRAARTREPRSRGAGRAPSMGGSPSGRRAHRQRRSPRVRTTRRARLGSFCAAAGSAGVARGRTREGGSRRPLESNTRWWRYRPCETFRSCVCGFM